MLGKVQVSTEEVEEGVRSIIAMVGEDQNREGLVGTPQRVRRAFLEMCEGYNQDPGDILSTRFSEHSQDMVVVKSIPFHSLCEHHLLPFHGTATVAYLPNESVVGLSKIPRLVHCFARRLQIQERLTSQIANALQANLNPLGVGVVVTAHHTCMSIRGVRSSADMVTSCLLGDFREGKTRQEFLALARAT